MKKKKDWQVNVIYSLVNHYFSVWKVWLHPQFSQRDYHVWDKVKFWILKSKKKKNNLHSKCISTSLVFAYWKKSESWRNQITCTKLILYSWLSSHYILWGLEENEVGWTEMSGKRKPEFLATEKACQATFWPTPSLKERTSDSSGVSKEEPQLPCECYPIIGTAMLIPYILY